jgi:hypothetical protein
MGDAEAMPAIDHLGPLHPPPPPMRPDAGPPQFDGSFVGPLLPPPPAPRLPPGPAPDVQGPPTEEVLAIPLGTRKLVATALDLLTRNDSGLRSASFFIGLMLLLTVAPAVILIVLLWLGHGEALFEPGGMPEDVLPWLSLAGLVAALGYVAASVDAASLATAVIGGRAEGRPLRLAESIAISRRRFWRVLGAQIIVGLVGSLAAGAAVLAVDAVLGQHELVDAGAQLFVGFLLGWPFVYVTAGIVLGEVSILDAITRSFRLVRARKRLGFVVALFGVASQFIVLLGESIGLDAVVRVATGAGLAEGFPPALAVVVTAAFVFAFGTLTFIVQAIVAAPAVYAFAALTHYTHGLELGRRNPLPARRPWQPWITPGLAILAGFAWLFLVLGVAALD